MDDERLRAMRETGRRKLDAFRRAKARRAAESAEAAAAKPPARPRRGRRARPPASSKSGVADLASLAAFDDDALARASSPPPPRRAPLAPLAMNDAAARGDATSSVLAMRAALATARREKAALRAENASLREDVARLEDLVDGLARLLEAGAASSGFDAGEEEGEATTTRNRSERTAEAARAETRGGDGAGTVAIARARASGALLPEDAVLAEDASSDLFAEFDAFLGGDAATNFYKEAGAEEGDASVRGGFIGRRRDGDGEGGGGLERRGDGGERDDAAPPRTFGDECADPLDAWLAGAVAATPVLFSPRGDFARTLDSAASRPGAPKDLGDSPFDRRSETVKGGVEGVEVRGAGRGGAAKRAS